MKLKISFKHLDHTPALDERIKEKSEKFEKFCEGNVQAHWVCWVHENEHWAEVKIHGPKFDFFAKACSDNMYKALDLVVDKMERQLEKKKDMRKNKIHKDPYHTPKYMEIESRLKDEEDFYKEESA
jgi:putative sigma-54 modulation protein